MENKNSANAAISKKIEYRKYRTAAGGEIVVIMARIDERGWINASTIDTTIAAPYYVGKLATARACVALVKIAEQAAIPLRQPQRDEAAAAAVAINEAHKQAQEQRTLAAIVAASRPAALLDMATTAGEFAAARKIATAHDQISRACKRFGVSLSEAASKEAKKAAKAKEAADARSKEAAKKYAAAITEAAKRRAEYERKEAAAKEAAKAAEKAAKAAEKAAKAAKAAAK